MDIKTAIENTKRIYMSDSSINVLMDFERVLDELDLYAFENWEDGELVEGPKIEKYWVTCSFMWPRKLMPNPKGGERLIPYGCKVSYEKTSIKVPAKIKQQEDFRAPVGERKGKLIPVPVWIVKIQMPQELIADIEQGSLEIAGEDVDLEEIQSAYQQGLDQQGNVKSEGEEQGMGTVATVPAPDMGGAPAGGGGGLPGVM